MNRRLGLLLTTRLIPALVLGSLGVGVAAAQALPGGSQLSDLQKRLLSGFASFALGSDSNSSQAPNEGLAALAAPTPPGAGPVGRDGAPNYFPAGNGNCQPKVGSNSKVNQNCVNLSDPDLQGRGQAQNETAIAQDPNSPKHLVAAFNDYRRGDGTCGTAWSVDGGNNWQDSTLPNGFVRGAAFGGVAREYFQASGDPSVAWDSQGNAYLNCQMFQRGTPTTNNPDFSSGIYLFRSTGNNGASWNFPGRPVVQDHDVTGASLLDKPYMTVDNTSGSPFQDRIYVTWTTFAADGTAYIYEAHSSDYGQSFSPPVAIGSSGSGLCPVTFGVPTPHGNCNENQYSQPFTGPDGTLYVAFANFNNSVTGLDNRNQMLLVKSTDGGVSFSAPVKVADYYDLPDCATYQGGQDAGRACVPEKGATANSVFRAANYPSGAVDPTNKNRIVIAFASYIGPHSNEANGCVPNGFSAFGNNLFTGVKTAGACKNDILISISTDGGASFTGTSTDPRMLTSAAQQRPQATASQWFQWLSFKKDGRLAISYYDRQYGNDEATGFSDVSISGSKDLSNFNVKRVTTSSMPPPTQFSGLFWGDYAGLTAWDQANPLWSDTRSPELFLCPGTGKPGVPPAVCTGSASNAPFANDQDIFTDSVSVP